MKAAFAGSFAVRLAEPVRRRLTIPCEIVTGDEAAILHQLGDANVLVSMAFTKEMAIAGPNLRLVQVPGAGLVRIERSQIRLGLALANAYGHEAGIAEYVIGTMIELTRSFQRIDQKLRAGHWESQWSVGTPAPPLWPELAGAALDVWYRYPTSAGNVAPSTEPFHNLSNVIMTPHVSGWTDGMLGARANVIAENIERTARGEPPLNAIPPIG